MILRIVAAGLALLVLVFITFSFYVSQPAFDEQRGVYQAVIADRSQALTFARSATAWILVTEHEDTRITGIDLTATYQIPASTDLLSWLPGVDQNELQTLAGPLVSVALDELTQPVDYTYPHIGVGTNFKAHAEEVYLDDPPFLFPKLARASAWNSDIPFLPRLDYEAELCAFPLEDIDGSGLDALPPFGLVLCNDVTDRWTLVKDLELSQPMGLTGFATGKGCLDCLPTGYLVVIPRSPEFYRSIELSLYVNDRLRQRFSMDDIILPIEGIVRQTFDARDEPYTAGDEIVSILPHGHMPKGTLLLTGTAAGVIFKPANIWHQGLYLQAGDVVRVEAPYLGFLQNRISGAQQ